MSRQPLIVPFVVVAVVLGLGPVALADPQFGQWGLEDVAESIKWLAASIAFAGVAIGAGLVLRPRN